MTLILGLDQLHSKMKFVGKRIQILELERTHRYIFAPVTLTFIDDLEYKIELHILKMYQ